MSSLPPLDARADAERWLPEIDERWVLAHRAHDARDVVRRWRAVARAARMRLEVIHETSSYPVLCLRSRGLTRDALYLSAGVHGDEPAGPQGLLAWAEANLERLRRGNVILFPLFNPVGLALNTRANENGEDMNRIFHLKEHPHIAAWWRAMEGVHAGLALCLHEDYDAQGLYCYEQSRNPGEDMAERFMTACERIIPRDLRKVIEGRRAAKGIIRPRRIPALLGLPESVALFRQGVRRTLTFETPSEFSLAVRARAQARLVEEGWRLVHGD